MSFLDKLLDGAEVEWRPLGEVAKYEQPTKYLVKSKIYNNNYNTPVLTAGKTFILGYTDEVNGIYKASENPVIIFDDFTTANKWVDFDFKAKSSAMKMITSRDESIFLIKYIYYWLNTLQSEIGDGDHKRQWISNYALKCIPIPCPNNPEKSLEIQRKIVAILDDFSMLTAELTAELTARKKQYDHYRDRLLSFGDEVEWKTLGEVLKIKNGRDYKHLNNGPIPVYGSGGLMTYVEEPIYCKPSVLIPRKGSIDKLYYLDIPFWTVDTLYYTDVYTNIVIPKFVYYYLQREHLEKYNTAGGVPSLTQAVLNKIPFPIPSLSEQQRIVDILDKFDTLTNSISEGLPKEIELRKKQYEYYRDMLFDFPKP